MICNTMTMTDYLQYYDGSLVQIHHTKSQKIQCQQNHVIKHNIKMFLNTYNSLSTILYTV